MTSLADERPVSIVKDLLAPQHRLQQIVFFSLGAIFFLMEFAWPIFLYRFLPDFGELGLFTSIVTILSAMVGALLMLVIDRMVKSKLLVLGSIIYSAGWVLRSFIFDTFSFFMSDLVSRIGEGFVMLPMFAMSYDLRERQDHTSFQLQRILVVSLGYVGPALLIVAFGAPMLKVLLYTAPVFCFLLLGIIRIK
ncbi:hypothetical protein AUK40_03630 [Candidatus Wirthbacteria bacterium CG2_30_54_11]|uniref:Major facilitator superfamily (MFS) profile domain-containing protein n=1 Tax=Candidatus Wirthbacteria bacterium CG2_30_54_11 TaxID=1817892 RepID=A0A1J5IVL6_9BACT|nr:MAG: hypothetical protein AUK40_03630 [Candidatus Wirthbacteria bacterium CG2_30_54_11]